MSHRCHEIGCGREVDPCMGFADLVAFAGHGPGAIGMDRAGFLAPHCALVMWCTWPIVARGDHVGLMREWGFTPKTGGSWTKQTRTGKLGFGTGFILRSASEPWLLGTRGNPAIGSRSERNALLDDYNGLVAEAGAHSVKPPEMHALIERLYPRGPYLELFARRPRAGWDCYGDELGGYVAAHDVSGLRAIPLTLREANAFVAKWHRHHGPARGMKLAIGALYEGELIAVILGRPVSRMRQDGATIETLRLCTDGVKRPLGRANRRGEPTYVNAASFLHGRAARIAAALGCRIGTYILEDETGVSVKAAGYRVTSRTRGGSWDRPGRHREDRHPTAPKLLLERGEARHAA